MFEFIVFLILASVIIYAAYKIKKSKSDKNQVATRNKLECINIGTATSKEHFSVFSRDIQEGWRDDTLMVARIEGKNPFPLGEQYFFNKKQKLYVNNELVGEIRSVYRSKTSEYTFFKE